jgi:hypothetical protein
MNLPQNNSVKRNDSKKMFRKLGTCSRTFAFLLDREFGHLKTTEEWAAEPLAGGIMQNGHQCGMLWGASLAVGAEAYRRYPEFNQAMAIAIKATQSIMTSFEQRNNTINCREITRCDFSNKLSMAKYFFSGRFYYCFKMAEKWTPEAIHAAQEGLDAETEDLGDINNCASETARKMGATDEQRVMVAGFAGGLGLSGNGCGALAAAIWMKTMAWLEEGNDKKVFKNPKALKTLGLFEEATNGELLCHKITDQKFATIASHADYINDGGCSRLINRLVLS